MADIALRVSGNQLDVMTIHNIQDTQIAAEAITAGAAVRYDTATGQFRNASTVDAPSARVYGIATRTVPVGGAVTAIRKGIVDGLNLDALAYDQAVQLSRNVGAIADATDATAGAVNVAVGRVVPARSNFIGSNPDKVLFIDL
jgi:hypothetical protein